MTHRMSRVSRGAAALGACASLAVAACGSGGKGPGANGANGAAGTNSGAAGATTAPQAEAADAGPFAAWDLPGRKAAFQGALVTPGASLGRWEAWSVTGDKVTVWDGTREKTLDLAVETPCTVKVTEKSAGGSSSTVKHYTLSKGAIVMGLGDAGSRKGPEAIACVSDRIVTLDAKGTCTQWEDHMMNNRWEPSPGTCAFVKEGDKEFFSVKIRGSDYRLVVDGDALMSEQLAGTHSEKAADFAAAKTARDARK